MQDLSKVTLLELVDRSACTYCGGEAYINQPRERPKKCWSCGGTGTKGRQVIFWDANKSIKLSVQDDGRTLKIFVSNRDEENT